ncbi:MAG: GNAT family N-acetyltransferase [Chloroflexales bacterium]|nr:GNAT family N-acetyltransferase [Chloroflexales bacterium]
MALMTWWRTDALPALPALPGFAAHRTDDVEQIAAVNRIPVREARARLRDGHHAYLATLDGQFVGYGWAATREASIGEVGLRFTLPHDERYLWDFATLPAFQGRGIYPRLLQAMLRSEVTTRAWILHAPENGPSGAGITRAGFRPVGRLAFRADASVALGGIRDDTRAWWGAATLGVELTDEPVSSCWCCPRGEASCGCWSPGPRLSGACACGVAVGVARRAA